jgi:hypothetical protein
MSTLDLQRLVDEETQADGLLYQSRWRVSSAFSNEFLLATSILCYCVQTQQKQPSTTLKPVGIEPPQLDKIRMLLEASKNIWSRQTTHSKEAQKAVAAIQYVLGNAGVDVRNSAAEQVFPASGANAAVSYFPGTSYLFGGELNWGCVAD